MGGSNVFTGGTSSPSHYTFTGPMSFPGGYPSAITVPSWGGGGLSSVTGSTWVYSNIPTSECGTPLSGTGYFHLGKRSPTWDWSTPHLGMGCSLSETRVPPPGNGIRRRTVLLTNIFELLRVTFSFLKHWVNTGHLTSVKIILFYTTLVNLPE